MSKGISGRHLIIIAGPTGVGKTDLAISIAGNYKTEIISFDSRQFYRELKIGTAKPSDEELQLIPHHFINSLSIFDPYNVGDFEKEALTLLEKLFEKHTVVVAVGGSGLFMQALCEGIDEMPEVDSEIRTELIRVYEEEGIETLQNELKRNDPDYFEIVDIQNPQRLIRALEVFRGTGKPYSQFRQKKEVNRSFTIHKIGLEMERESLYQRIELRMDQMISKGLFEEAEEFFKHRELNALQTVGYSEVFGYLEGNYDKEEAIRLLKRNSRRYAKRQLTWFRRDPEIHWITPKDNPQGWLDQRINP